MTKINAKTIQLVKKTAIDKINKLTDDEVGEEIRKFFDPSEPPPDIPQKDIDALVEKWLGDD